MEKHKIPLGEFRKPLQKAPQARKSKFENFNDPESEDSQSIDSDNASYPSRGRLSFSYTKNEHVSEFYTEQVPNPLRHSILNKIITNVAMSNNANFNESESTNIEKKYII